MDPLSIGTAVAILAARSLGKKAAEKASEKLGEEAGEAGWALGQRILDTARDWFGNTDKTAEKQLAELEAATDPVPAQVDAVANLVDERLPAAPSVRERLAPMIQSARRDPELGPLLQQAAATQQAGRDTIYQRAGDNSFLAGRDMTIGQLPDRPKPTND
jgi:hypothetical protein